MRRRLTNKGVVTLDPIILAIATAIAGKAAESLTDQAKLALAGIARRVRDKFQQRPADLAALAAAQADIDSPERIAELAQALQRTGTEDPAFSDEIRTLWSQVQAGTTTSGDAVTNIFGGQAEKVVQLRDVHGDLNIG